MGIPIKHLSEMENGKIKPEFDFLYKFEKYFNVNLSYIIIGKETIMAIWERPIIKMCEALLKENGQEFRELIRDMYKSDRVCRAVIDHFLIYKVQKNDWINEDKLRSKKKAEEDEE